MTDFPESLFHLPSPAYLHLIRYILLGATLTFFAYAGLVLGGSVLSVSTSLGDRNGKDSFVRPLSRHFMEASSLSLLPILILALLPLITVGLIATSLFHFSLNVGSNLWPGVLILAVSGSLLLLLYKAGDPSIHSPGTVRLLLGGGGTGLFFLAYLLVIVQTGSYMNTELWQFSDRPVTLFLTWNNCARIGLYLLLSLAAAGARLLQIMYGKNGINARQGNAMKNTAKGITLATLLLLPFLIVADIYTLPTAALNGMVYLTGAFLLLLPWAAVIVLLESFRNDRSGSGTVIFILVILTFPVAVTLDHLGREQATAEKMILLQEKSETEKTAPPPGAETPVKKKQDLFAEGENVFDKVCSACHRFDQKLVGPPYNLVVPRYRGKVDELKAFIRNPVKLDPAYPAMPKLGLKEEEIEAVAVFLLEKTRDVQ